MNDFFKTIFLGNSVKDWFIAAGIILAGILILRSLRLVVLKKIRNLASITKSTFDDFIVDILQTAAMPLLYVFCVYFGLKYLSFPASADRIIHVALLAVTVFFIIKIIAGIFEYFLRQYTARHSEDPAQAKPSRGIILILKIILWVIGITFLIDNLGYNITTIITGLGIGGIAIALASQAILGDLFSYFVIFFDKPFDTGDFIIVGDKSGIVEYIGIKTTRLRTLGGEQLIISNTDLTNSRVQNFKRMEKRRVLFSIGIVYETDSNKLREIPSMIREIVAHQEGTEFERAHFSGFGDASLNFEIVYHILTADYLQYMDIHQKVCFAIFEKFANEQIEFAYPTQKLFVETTNNLSHSE